MDLKQRLLLAFAKDFLKIDTMKKEYYFLTA
jgi:hypothetical protein